MDPRQVPAGAVTCTTAAPIRHRETHRAYMNVKSRRFCFMEIEALRLNLAQEISP
jgi:hypothetical protein